MAKRQTNEDLRRENTRLWREKKAAEGEVQRLSGHLRKAESAYEGERSMRQFLIEERADDRALIGSMARFISKSTMTANASCNQQPID